MTEGRRRETMTLIYTLNAQGGNDIPAIHRYVNNILANVDSLGVMFNGYYNDEGHRVRLVDILNYIKDLIDIPPQTTHDLLRRAAGKLNPSTPPEQGKGKRAKTGGLTAGDIERIQKWPHCCRVLENFMKTIVEAAWQGMEELTHVDKWRDQVYYSQDPANHIKEEPRNPIDAFEYWASVLMWNVYPETMKNLQKAIAYTPNNPSVVCVCV